MRVRLISIVVMLLTSLPIAGYGSSGAGARFEKSLRDIKSIPAVEVEWVDTFWLCDPKQLKFMGCKEFSRTVEYSVLASESKYRARSRLVSGTQTNLAKLFESAFDGTSYVTYSGDFRYMTTSSVDGTGDNAQSPNNPFVAPFMFLTRYSDSCKMCMLRFKDVISLRSAQVVLPPAQGISDGSIEISLRGQPVGKAPTTWRITLDEVEDSFTPKLIKFLAPGARYQVATKLLNYTNLGPYRFPTRMEMTTSTYPPTSPLTLVSTGSVVVVSARILDKIPDSALRLDEQEVSAKAIWDWDRHKLTRMAPELVRLQRKNYTAKIVLLLIFFATVAIPAIMAIQARKSASKRK